MIALTGHGAVLAYRQRQAVWVPERRAVHIERLPRSVDRPPEVVDRVTVGGAERVALGVDAG